MERETHKHIQTQTQTQTHKHTYTHTGSRMEREIYTLIQKHADTDTNTYGVATVSRIDEMIGLFCRILSLL